MENIELAMPASPILPLHLRQALLAGVAIVQRAGPEMLHMLRSHMVGENKARFGNAIRYRGLRTSICQKITALFLDEPRQVIAYFIGNGLDALDMTDPQGNDMTVFVERGTQSIDQFGALVNDALACAE